MVNKDLKRRIIDISYKHKLSHLGSCLTAVDLIENIYLRKKPDEKFVLSSGHAALGLYVVIEKHEGIDAEKIFEHHGVHPDRCGNCHLYCSTGSLGQGLPIALGMALADRKKNVYCLISDGECAEGSIRETVRIMKEQNVYNLKVSLNFNGWAAYKRTYMQGLIPQDFPTSTFTLGLTYTDDFMKYFPFLRDQEGHYHVMTMTEYIETKQRLDA